MSSLMEWNDLFESSIGSTILSRVLSYLSLEEQCRQSELVCKRWKDNSHVEAFVLENSKHIQTKFEHIILPNLLLRHGNTLKSFRVDCSFWEQKNTKLITVDVLRRIVKSCPNITELSLPMCSNLTSSTETSPLQSLASLENLEKLNLSGCNLTDEHLKALSKLSKIKELNLSINRYVSDLGIKYLFQQSTSTIGGCLQALDLSFTSIGDDSVLCIRTLSTLKQLHLMHTSVTHKGLQNLCAFEHGPKLEKLNLLNCMHVTELPFLNSARLSNLKAFMYSLPSTATIENHLSHLTNLTMLTELVLVNMNVLTSCMMKIISQITTLDTLSIRCNQIEDSRCDSSVDNSVMKMLEKLSHLKKVDLQVVEMDPISEGVIEALKFLPNLEFLSVQSLQKAKASKLLNELFNKYSDSTVGEKLKFVSIDVPGYNVDSSGFKFFANNCKQLESICVPLSDNIPFAKYSLSNLKHFTLAQSSMSRPFSDESMCELLAHTGHSLQKLSIRAGSGMSQVLENIVKYCPNLTDLEVDLNVLSSDDAVSCSIDSSLQALSKLHYLQRLSLSGNENLWSINKSIVPLARSMTNLTELCLPSSKIATCSSMLFEKLFPHTTIQEI
ncbi:hypothetical protein C9374_006628 [Naegleria lovaniensis]|uniref:F-box domain-containing protein n=1 Tax=Naegleria lovaniensis TaxID=51637 RepID=A0AA88KIT2_NAELO|nr:uncharacterized protein C9374_006628 [Naegleria lovaniensis]KAG2379511.1 hypothetical protein C9374_006628 [Naegleria lovaniensis]